MTYYGSKGSARVYERLAGLIGEEPQTAKCRHRAVLTDKEGDPVSLRESGNDGKSSSIFPLAAEGLDRWPEAHETGLQEPMRSRTLDGVAGEFGLLDTVDTLVVDVQGAELLVLKGAERVLRQARAVIAEVSTRPYYEGGVLFPELRAFLKERHFAPISRPRRHGDLLFLRED